MSNRMRCFVRLAVLAIFVITAGATACSGNGNGAIGHLSAAPDAKGTGGSDGAATSLPDAPTAIGGSGGYTGMGGSEAVADAAADQSATISPADAAPIGGIAGSIGMGGVGAREAGGEGGSSGRGSGGDGGTIDANAVGGDGGSSGKAGDSGTDGSGGDSGDWSPAQLPNLSLWLMADRGVITQSSRVTTWQDQSGNNNTATQSVEARCPLQVTEVMNGHAVIRFDGVGTALHIADSPSITWPTNDFTIEVVVSFTNQTSTSLGYGLIVAKQVYKTAPFPGPSLWANYPLPGGLSTVLGVQLNTSQYVVSSATGLNDGTPRILAGRRTGVTNLEARVNGVASGQAVVTSVDSSATGNFMFIGGQEVNNSVVQALSGDIAEIVAVGGTISISDLAMLETYLKAKYGLGGAGSDAGTNSGVDVPLSDAGYGTGEAGITTTTVFTTETGNMLDNPTWITARALNENAVNPSYEVFGCGFEPAVAVTLHANNSLGQTVVASATAQANGCFDAQTIAVPAAYIAGGIVSLEADDGTVYSHVASAGIPAEFVDCVGESNDYGAISYFMASRSADITYCMDPKWWTTPSNALAFKGFDVSFPDRVRQQLTADFGLPFPSSRFTVEVGPYIPRDAAGNPNGPSTANAGLAHTGSSFGLGEFLSADTVITASNAPDGTIVMAAWAYIFMVQECVNDYTVIIGGGWPTDWWADHRSPFPTAVNWNILNELGTGDIYTIECDYNHGPPSPDFVQGFGVVYDTQASMFDSLRASAGGWNGFANAFAYLHGDKMILNELKDPPLFTTQTQFVSGNPSALLTDYVIAYLSLGFQKDLYATIVTQNGVGERPSIYINGTLTSCWNINGGCDTGAGEAMWPGYTPSDTEIRSVATAHCALAAASTASLAGRASSQAVASGYAALRVGNYASALTSTTGGNSQLLASDCPSECKPNGSSCGAPW